MKKTIQQFCLKTAINQLFSCQYILIFVPLVIFMKGHSKHPPPSTETQHQTTTLALHHQLRQKSDYLLHIFKRNGNPYISQS